jgi:hypothetical protein
MVNDLCVRTHVDCKSTFSIARLSCHLTMAYSTPSGLSGPDGYPDSIVQPLRGWVVVTGIPELKMTAACQNDVHFSRFSTSLEATRTNRSKRRTNCLIQPFRGLVVPSGLHECPSKILFLPDFLTVYHKCLNGRN